MATSLSRCAGAIAALSSSVQYTQEEWKRGSSIDEYGIVFGFEQTSDAVSRLRHSISVYRSQTYRVESYLWDDGSEPTAIRRHLHASLIRRIMRYLFMRFSSERFYREEDQETPHRPPQLTGVEAARPVSGGVLYDETMAGAEGVMMPGGPWDFRSISTQGKSRMHNGHAGHADSRSPSTMVERDPSSDWSDDHFDDVDLLMQRWTKAGPQESPAVR